MLFKSAHQDNALNSITELRANIQYCAQNLSGSITSDNLVAKSKIGNDFRHRSHYDEAIWACHFPYMVAGLMMTKDPVNQELARVF